MYRTRSRIWSSTRTDRSGGLPGFIEFIQLFIYPVTVANNKAASNFQEDFMANLWNCTQFLEQGLLWTLR